MRTSLTSRDRPGQLPCSALLCLPVRALLDAPVTLRNQRGGRISRYSGTVHCTCTALHDTALHCTALRCSCSVLH